MICKIVTLKLEFPGQFARNESPRSPLFVNVRFPGSWQVPDYHMFKFCQIFGMARKRGFVEGWIETFQPWLERFVGGNGRTVAKCRPTRL